MIKYNLKCKNKHEFESWFSNSKEYEKLKKKNLLECIYCKSTQIEKSIMSPKVLNKRILSKKYENDKKEIEKIKNNLQNIRNFVEKNFEYVGDKFAKEVKDIYYDKKTDKKIYGTTTQEEREELKEEGIDLVSIPWIKKDN